MTHAIQLQDGEHIITIVRRHWFHLAIEGIVDIVVFVGVFIVLSILDAMFLSGGGFDTQKSFAIVLVRTLVCCSSFVGTIFHIME